MWRKLILWLRCAGTFTIFPPSSGIDYVRYKPVRRQRQKDHLALHGDCERVKDLMQPILDDLDGALKDIRLAIDDLNAVIKEEVKKEKE